MSKPTSRDRWRIGYIGDVPPTNKQSQGHNRAAAADADARLIGRLHCQADGCRETLAYLEQTPADEPAFMSSPWRLAIRAPWTPAPATDPKVHRRIVLTGETDPRLGTVMYIAVTELRRGLLEIVCRRGHESRFGVGHITSRLHTA